LERQPEPELADPLDPGAPEAPGEVAVDLNEQVAMMNEEPEEPVVVERRPDEEASLESEQGLETVDAEIERAGEDKAPLEAEAERFIGVPVINADGDELGVVQELLVDLDGTLQGVVLNVAAFGGTSERQVVVNWDAITISGDDRLVIDLAREDIEQLPTADRPRL
jgi:sporulation protein YlmC with PRC-barrel domain